MKNNYQEPVVEIVVLAKEDVLGASVYDNGDGTYDNAGGEKWGL